MTLVPKMYLMVSRNDGSLVVFEEKRNELSLKEKIEFVINNDFVKLSYSEAFEILKNCKPNKKNKFTSAAVIYLGARVIKTKGIATQKIHIAGIIKKSLPLILRSSTKNKAISAIISLATIAEGIKFVLFLPALIITAPAASPTAHIKPYIFPLMSPFSNESINIYITAYVHL